MKLPNYKPRLIDERIKLYLTTFGALLLEGPKWCGKTWSAKNACNSEFLLSDPTGNFNNRQLAITDPKLALNGERPRLIDEWQEAPSLWDAVRWEVDETPEKGQFILTGSSSINKDRYIHTGTGRIAHLKMRTMSLFESGDSSGQASLLDICENRSENIFTGEIKLTRIIDLILRGGWPAGIGLDTERSTLLSHEYVNAILNEDIYKVDGRRRDRRKIKLLLKSLSRNESTTATDAKIKQDIKDKDQNDIDSKTIADYLDLLHGLHLTENIPPFGPSIRSPLRVKQSEKRHFVDPSIPCAILNCTESKLINNLDYLGFLFESLVERDLLTYCDAIDARLFHYQDYEDNEIDAVIEFKDGSWCGVEIKLGANKIDEAAKNLLRVNERIKSKGGKEAKSLLVICGLSSASYKREDGVYVAPITSLRP